MSTTLPSGVERHGKTLRIHFMFRGQRCREIVERGVIDDVAIAIAGRMREQIVDAIAAGRFDYLQRFPSSPMAHRLARQPDGQGANAPQRSTPPAIEDMTVRVGVEAWLQTQRLGRARSTAVNYASKAQHVIRAFGDRLIREVSTQELQQFCYQLVRSRHNPEGLAPKTVNDVLIVVRGVWGDAQANDITRANRSHGLKNHRVTAASTADPFSLEEMQRLLWADPNALPLARLVVCNCWMGLSRSELMALASEDVDLDNRLLHVRRAFVCSEHKAPKELLRERTIDLLEPAVQLLRLILQDTAEAPLCRLQVTALDNLTIREEAVHLLFRNPRTAGPWSSSALDRWFRGHQAKAQVRYRGLNQCRHTFASRALSNYAPEEWVIRQLGHRDKQMLLKHYGQWLPKEHGGPTKVTHDISIAMSEGWQDSPPEPLISGADGCPKEDAALSHVPGHLRLVS